MNAKPLSTGKGVCFQDTRKLRFGAIKDQKQADNPFNPTACATRRLTLVLYTG